MESNKTIDFNREQFDNLQKGENGNVREEEKYKNGIENKKRREEEEEEEETFKIFQGIKDDQEKNQEIFQTRSNIIESGKTISENIKVLSYHTHIYNVHNLDL